MRETDYAANYKRMFNKFLRCLFIFGILRIELFVIYTVPDNNTEWRSDHNY